MKKELASALMTELTAMSEPLNRATTLAMSFEFQHDREAFLRNLGTIMNVIYIDLMRPIINQYPELDPDIRDSSTQE
jgi:hypothetical protein